MRLLKLIGVLALVIIFSTGCKSNTSDDNPINLFDELPIYNKDKSNISKEVKRISGSSDLILPLNSIEVGKINEVDLNNDGKDEIVFFEKKENIKNEVGFTILDSSDDENNDISYMESGNTIEYANFYDLDRDGNKEIILIMKEKNNKTLTICRYKNGKIEELISKNNYDYFNKDGFTKLGIIIDDINDDNILELVVYNYNHKSKEMNLNICNLEDNKISILDSLTFKDVKNFDNINISVGEIATKQKALFLSLLNIENNDYITEVVYLEEDKLVNAFEKYKEYIRNKYYIAFDDINNDGITNIPVINPNSINIDTLSKSAAPTSLIVSWNKYNGKKDKSADLLFVSQFYYNYEFNFKFLIPNNLVGKIVISDNMMNSNSSNKSFNFYYNTSTDFYLEDDNKDKNLLFTLNLLEKNIVEDTKNMNKTNTNIFETNKYSFTINNVDNKKLKKLDLTVDILKGYFLEIK